MNRDSAGYGRRRVLVTLFPVACLLAGAANHFRLVHGDDLSPWLGGGFGMFSTTDVGSTRRVFVTAETADGRHHPVTLGEPMRELVERARGLPDAQRLSALASATRDALVEVGAGLSAEEIVAIKVEVWKSRFQPRSLRPAMGLIVNRRFVFGDRDGDR